MKRTRMLSRAAMAAWIVIGLAAPAAAAQQSFGGFEPPAGWLPPSLDPTGVELQTKELAPEHGVNHGTLLGGTSFAPGMVLSPYHEAAHVTANEPNLGYAQPGPAQSPVIHSLTPSCGNFAINWDFSWFNLLAR